MFADLTLAKRLEHAEGRACVEFAEARRRVFPSSAAEWIECGGAYAVFDGIESPITQTFGLGLFEPLDAAVLDSLERFFHQHGAVVQHEVCPLAGVQALELLCRRGYCPAEISNVLWRIVEAPAGSTDSRIRVRVIGAEEAPLWAGTSARGWAHEHPELRRFFDELGVIAAARHGALCFLAELDGVAGAAGSLSIDDGVALFGGASTIPEFRRKGLQSALLRERLRHACESGCDLAMMVAEAGSDSQRNAERAGFRVAYTRTKWMLR